MIKTRVTEMLGIKYPIIEAGMMGVSYGELAAAVSNAGALGTLVGAMGAERLQIEIRKAKSLTNKPLAVNLPHLVFRTWETQRMWDVIDVVIAEDMRIAIMSSGNPNILFPRLRQAGMIVLQVGATVKHARGAQEAGVDMFVANGAEAGGGASYEQIGNLALVPQVVDALKIPVLVGGAMADARSFMAALALGAEGIYVGTRFVATHESPASPQHKQAIVLARDDSTAVKPGGGRGLSKEFIQEIFPGSENTFGAGQGAGLVRDIVSAEEVVTRFINGAAQVMERLSTLGFIETAANA